MDYVVSDHYTESTYSHVLLQGSSGINGGGRTRHGRVTIGAVKVHTLGDPDAIEIDGFVGNFSHIGRQFTDPASWGSFAVGQYFAH